MATDSSESFLTGWISDLHLGQKEAQPEAVLELLRQCVFQRLYIVGDLLNCHAIAHTRGWNQAHNDVVQKLLRAGRKGTELIYIPGNHDEFVLACLGTLVGTFGNIQVLPEAVHKTADGKEFLVAHGHEFDRLVQFPPLALLADRIRRILMRVGVAHWPIWQQLKSQVVDQSQYECAFVEKAIAVVRARGLAGIICGHTHTMRQQIVAGTNAFAYYNLGHWTDPTACTFLVEHMDGRLEMRRISQGTASIVDPVEPEGELLKA